MVKLRRKKIHSIEQDVFFEGKRKTACNVVCSESSNSTIGSTSGNVINQILYITPTDITFYKLKSDGTTFNKNFDISSFKGFNYQAFLSVAYCSQSDFDTAEHFAEYISANSIWKDKINEELKSEDNKIVFWEAPKKYDYDTSIEFEKYGEDISHYKYSGIFVFYSIGAGAGQGRMAYHVVRERKVTPVNITLTKLDTLGNTALPNTTFHFVFDENLEDITGISANNKKNFKMTTNDNGQIEINGIVPKDDTKPIKITVTETKVPTAEGHYYKAISEFTITITPDGNGKFKVSTSNTSKTSISVSGNNVSLKVKNQPLITLSGQVWLDGQTGVKNASGPNGTKDNKDNKEEGIDGVLVGLYSVKDKKVIKTQHTTNGGKYEFKDVEQTKEGYQIVFSYDGINYIETKATNTNNNQNNNNQNYGTQSKADEQNRTAFNDKFKTISKDIATGTDGKSSIKLGYDYDSNNKISTLRTTMDGTNPANNNAADFRMTAQTGRYQNTTSNIDCGLVKKEFDLALGTDVKSARLEINEKSVEYSYAQIMNGDMKDIDLDNILQGKSSDNQEVAYNLYLYKSDYNYRISDYKTDGSIENKVDDNDDNKVNNYESLKELQAYVTYNVILKGQTTQSSTVNEFVYYYDSKYEPTFKVGDIIDGYKVDSINDNKIVLSSAGNDNVIKSNDYRKEVNLEFKVLDLTPGGEFTNIAEITKYSTDEGGLIDKDSAPDNGVANGNITKYEDDTDQAKGITISLKNDARTIEGTVFEDTDKDGYLNNENKPVNDVIVQLIEIKKISGNYYEYIWQETRSGSNQVKTTARNGYEGNSYTNNVTAGSGNYEFKDYIPGNYIIRYIYGDGTTYDLTENVQKYNGQDYKSTVDAHYNAPWYNTAGYTTNDAGEYPSVARDNEARRLEVMAYSTTIDEANGEALERRNKEDLKNTWMAAETSRINVPVDADNTGNSDDSTNVSYDNIKNTVSFSNVNFGLALRPETKLILEKHITGLKITPNGTGVQPIVDAKSDIEGIINDNTITTSGVKDGLATIKSTRDNRGFWQVATDVEELAQGAELEVEYTYVIRNDSDEDYLSKTLVDAYRNQDIKPYNDVLNEVTGTVKTTMKNGTYSYSNSNKIGAFLGSYYYNGDSTRCAEVPSRVETLEEQLNNELVFDSTEGTSGDDFEKTTATESKIIYDEEGNPKEADTVTVIENTEVSDILTRKTGEKYVNDDTAKTADFSKTIKLRKLLSTSNGGSIEGNLPSYIAEIVKYSNAAGRRNMSAEPANLSYVHSDDKEMTLNNSWLYEKDGKTYETQNKENIPEGATNIREANEEDEFWAETIIVTKPTGQDNISPMQIAIITVSSIAVLGVGIVLIKKFVLKK